MTEKSGLKIGSFYWVQVAFDPDTDLEWENREMPARFAGLSPSGRLLWNFLNQEGESDWAVRYIGPEIVLNDVPPPVNNPNK